MRDLPEALITGRERLYLAWFYRSAAYHPTAVTEAEIDEYVRCYSAPGALRAGFEYYRAIFTDAEHNTENAKTKLKMPVLVMNGEFDNSLVRSREMSKKIAGAAHHVIPGAGHACCLEDPTIFDEIVLAFLRKHNFIKD